MRPILPGDLDAAARRLLALPPCDWAAEADAMVWQADIADRYRKRLGKAHVWGDGSLMARAMTQPRGAVGADAKPFMRAMAVVIDAILKRANRVK